MSVMTMSMVPAESSLSCHGMQALHLKILLGQRLEVWMHSCRRF